jgi:hypothetical protein
MAGRESLTTAGAPMPVDTKAANKRGGRQPAPFWRDMEKKAEAWLKENGCPAEGDGEQAKLERHIAALLDARHLPTSESQIRRYVSRWIHECRTRLILQA